MGAASRRTRRVLTSVRARWEVVLAPSGREPLISRRRLLAGLLLSRVAPLAAEARPAGRVRA